MCIYNIHTYIIVSLALVVCGVLDLNATRCRIAPRHELPRLMCCDMQHIEMHRNGNACAERVCEWADGHLVRPCTWHMGRRFRGYGLTYTVKGPRFEETKTQIVLNQIFLE